jgi:hypothetical protein
LRFERVDNLGAYSIPPETGLLIPSAYVNHGTLSVLVKPFTVSKHVWDLFLEH